eukprot:1161928-Pelagomonas_calceolata.AAC.13
MHKRHTTPQSLAPGRCCPGWAKAGGVNFIGKQANLGAHATWMGLRQKGTCARAYTHMQCAGTPISARQTWKIIIKKTDKARQWNALLVPGPEARRVH